MTHIAEDRWLAVRCCCQPRKVLGFLPVSEGVFNSKVFHSPYIDGPVQIKSMYENKRDGDMELTIRYERAIYSEDRPIEVWRNVPGFVEAA